MVIYSQRIKCTLTTILLWQPPHYIDFLASLTGFLDKFDYFVYPRLERIVLKIHYPQSHRHRSVGSYNLHRKPVYKARLAVNSRQCYISHRSWIKSRSNHPSNKKPPPCPLSPTSHTYATPFQPKLRLYLSRIYLLIRVPLTGPMAP